MQVVCAGAVAVADADASPTEEGVASARVTCSQSISLLQRCLVVDIDRGCSPVRNMVR